MRAGSDLSGDVKSFGPTRSSEVVAAPVCPVKPRLLVLQNIPGDYGLVVAADRHFGDIPQSLFLGELLPHLSRHAAVTPNIDDLVVPHHEHHDLIAVARRDLARRSTVGGLVGSDGHLT